ncbi:arsenate reductase [Zavarzinia sp.]|uniref:arsenate reductase n=1 Tax=Zavarzinia sp. TaxID=2027920 RepID=UPI003563A26E
MAGPAKPVLYGIPNCDTMKKARVFLDGLGIAYDFHDYKKAGVDADSLRRWCDALGFEKVLNRAGTTFRKLPEAERQDLDKARAIALMVAQPSMIRRPILEGEGLLLCGFAPDTWRSALARS